MARFVVFLFLILYYSALSLSSLRVCVSGWVVHCTASLFWHLSDTYTPPYIPNTPYYSAGAPPVIKESCYTMLHARNNTHE